MFRDKWWPEEDEQLKELFGRGLSDAEIGEEMKRSATAVEKQRRKLKLRRWRAWEIERGLVPLCS